MFRIWCERPLPEQFHAMIDGFAETITIDRTHTDGLPAQLAAHHIDAVIASAVTRYDDALMAAVPSLKVIARTGIGVDNIDLDAATAHGIAICNAPDAPTLATAEHTIGLIFAVLKHLKRWSSVLPNGERFDFFTHYRGLELEGTRLGVVGLGRIGSQVATKARALGMIVIGYDPYATPQRAAELGITLADSLEALLPQVDVLTLHLPATAETRHLMNAARFALMKPGAYLINAARGSLVDEAALLAALESGHLHGAGLDVFDPEPPAADHPLLHREDVIATPHIAGSTLSGKDRLWRDALMGAVMVLKGEQPPTLVNPQVWHTRRT
jgi:D-3-phosphoglycerate dehydrogenase